MKFISRFIHISFGISALMCLSSCALIFLSSSVQSSMATKAPIVTTGEATGHPQRYKDQIVQLYGRFSNVQTTPCLDGLVELVPTDRTAFVSVKEKQAILVRGIFRVGCTRNGKQFSLASAVFYPGIEKGHEATLSNFELPLNGVQL